MTVPLTRADIERDLRYAEKRCRSIERHITKLQAELAMWQRAVEQAREWLAEREWEEEVCRNPDVA